MWSSNKPESATVDNSGKVTAKAAGTAVITATAGDKSARCTVTVNAAEQSIVLTENTDYSALVGEKVTEDGWKAAFAASAYDHVTVTISSKDAYEEEDVKATWKKSGKGLAALYFGDALYEVVHDTGDMVVEIALGSYWEMEIDGYVGIEYGKADMTEENADIIYNWWFKYTSTCPDFSEYFSAFEYDETLKAYTFDHKTVRTNSIYEYWEVDYNFATVKIINGKLAFVNAGNYDIHVEEKLNDTDIFFYDFGITEITVPQYTTVDPNDLEYE